MQRARALLLADVLREMREQDGGHFPAEAWNEIHRSFAIPYVELVIPRRAAAAHLEFFLSRREADDPNWTGRPWHIPGGIWRVHQTMDEACNGVASRELGISVASSAEVMTYKWPNPPYANPISPVCVCVPSTAPTETEAARFW